MGSRGPKLWSEPLPLPLPLAPDNLAFDGPHSILRSDATNVGRSMFVAGWSLVGRIGATNISYLTLTPNSIPVRAADVPDAMKALALDEGEFIARAQGGNIDAHPITVTGLDLAAAADPAAARAVMELGALAVLDQAGPSHLNLGGSFRVLTTGGGAPPFATQTPTINAGQVVGRAQTGGIVGQACSPAGFAILAAADVPAQRSHLGLGLPVERRKTSAQALGALGEVTFPTAGLAGDGFTYAAGVFTCTVAGTYQIDVYASVSQPAGGSFQVHLSYASGGGALDWLSYSLFESGGDAARVFPYHYSTTIVLGLGDEIALQAAAIDEDVTIRNGSIVLRRVA